MLLDGDKIPQNVLSELQKDYEVVKSLLQTSDQDTDLNESYCERLNSARNIIKKMVVKISSFSNDHGYSLRGTFWTIHANVDSISEEISDQEENLKKAFEEFTHIKNRELCVLQEIEALNQLGWIWIHRACYEEGRKHLESANDLFTEYSSKSNNLHNIDSLLDPSSFQKSNYILETSNLCTACALANAYQKLGLHEEAAKKCLYALDRQLELGNYDPIDWCEKALSILSHLMKNSMFLTAKKYLAITFTICSKKETMEYERYPRIFANAQGQLGKFCLSIMERKEISNDKEVPIPTVIELDPDVMSIPTKPVTSLEEALTMYTIGCKSLNLAAKYFTLDDHCIDYIIIVQCMCSMLHVIVKFQSSPEKKYKTYRKQVEMMDKVLKILNPSHYMEESRSLWMESGRSYEEMFKIKEDSKQRNTVISLAIHNYTKFVESFTLPSITDSEEGISVIVAYLHLGKLYGKLQPPKDVKYARQCQWECYSLIRNFCQQNPTSPIILKNKEVITEMLEFIDSFHAIVKK
ncbi:KIF-binding protein [Lepeophtheirus salmonis]|uniref:KIF-binding protein n=1 Tax=Lepeophtheirus salmonis TaxID=72036 RepID=UPI001AE56A61|nr:KIF-binding protein-like [Lepeophtheirus salmonis]XP_040576200.1 KIF-binding protein-like [Lepeophtheirus salmonis]